MRLTTFGGRIGDARTFQFLFEPDVEDTVTVVDTEDDSIGQETGYDDDPGVNSAVWNIWIFRTSFSGSSSSPDGHSGFRITCSLCTILHSCFQLEYWLFAGLVSVFPGWDPRTD